jgi:hypothetical protein
LIIDKVYCVIANYPDEILVVGAYTSEEFAKMFVNNLISIDENTVFNIDKNGKFICKTYWYQKTTLE